MGSQPGRATEATQRRGGGGRLKPASVDDGATEKADVTEGMVDAERPPPATGGIPMGAGLP